MGDRDAIALGIKKLVTVLLKVTREKNATEAHHDDDDNAILILPNYRADIRQSMGGRHLFIYLAAKFGIGLEELAGHRSLREQVT